MAKQFVKLRGGQRGIEQSLEILGGDGGLRSLVIGGRSDNDLLRKKDDLRQDESDPPVVLEGEAQGLAGDRGGDVLSDTDVFRRVSKPKKLCLQAGDRSGGQLLSDRREIALVLRREEDFNQDIRPGFRGRGWRGSGDPIGIQNAGERGPEEQDSEKQPCGELFFFHTPPEELRASSTRSMLPGVFRLPERPGKADGLFLRSFPRDRGLSTGV